MSSEGKTSKQGDLLKETVTPVEVLVNGRQIDALPEDLYIPPEALEVFLDSFQGPLDLLLYLIRKQNIDILDIPIADITRQYMKYVELMRKIRLDLAAEYLVMAAMLAQIKSRMLLPRQDPDAEGEEEDPRAALIKQLQRYEQFAQAAKEIDELPRLERDLHLTEPHFVQEFSEDILPQATLNELAVAFRAVMIRAQQNQNFHIQPQTLSMREKMVHILEKLQKGRHIRFEALFTEAEGREGVVVSFVAILELVRDGLIIITQNEAFSPIHVKVAA
ncbi:MAG: segregation/condensation protein A [Proteobacteria bacterium]|nr:segregation/condensation protein A [Pseudomonadota bacterium]